LAEPNNSKTFDRAILVMALFAVLTAGLAAVAAVRAGGSTETETGGGPSVAQIDLTEWAITGDLEVPPGALTIELTNSGTMVHNLAFENGPNSVDVDPGDTVTFSVGNLESGTYTIFCGIAGHRAAGMEARLVVTGVPTHGDGADDEMTPAEMDQVMIESMLAFPAETAGIGNQPLDPTEIKADGTKVFDLTASVIDWEVRPGQIVDAWAYNGQVPGPWIRLDVGDQVEINVTYTGPYRRHWHSISTQQHGWRVAVHTARSNR
jgi:plastocyanin